jgi:acyl-coenzyme A synthetase/AMP-(fatty) acid ligase
MAAYCIGRAALNYPDKTALLVYDTGNPREAVEELTYAELERAVLSISSALSELGLQRGDRVGIRLGNSTLSALMFFGAIAGGFVALPLSDQLTPTELRTLLEDSGAAVLASAEPFDSDALPAQTRFLSVADVNAMLRARREGEYADTFSEDSAFLIYTSGTTARPKGVLHAHRSALGRRPMYHGWYGISSADRMLHAGAFNWTFTLGVGLMDPWANGATSLVCIGDKAPELWPDIIRSTNASLFAAVPGVFRQMLKYARGDVRSLGRLRHGLMAGETPPPGLFDAWTEATGLPLYEALGMSEISTYISTGPTVPYKAGTVGKPQAGRRVAILPVQGGEAPLESGREGLIAVHRSDPGLMLGYWRRPEEESEVYRGEWFTGGDLGMFDADGYIVHLGRANEIMNAGGYRVSPHEIEAVIASCPGVAEVACTEIRPRADVSIIAAFVVSAEHQSIDADGVKTFAASRLAPYKCPREVVFVEHLPRTANGKLRRKALTEMFAARAASDV